MILSGHPLQKLLERLRAQEAGSVPVDWLLKPPSLQQLADTISKALEP